MEGGKSREWGSGGGDSVGSGEREITELSLSELSCEWRVTVSDWPTEIGLGPTAPNLLCKHTCIHSNPQNTPYQ